MVVSVRRNHKQNINLFLSSCHIWINQLADELKEMFKFLNVDIAPTNTMLVASYKTDNYEHMIMSVASTYLFIYLFTCLPALLSSRLFFLSLIVHYITHVYQSRINLFSVNEYNLHCATFRVVLKTPIHCNDCIGLIFYTILLNVINSGISYILDVFSFRPVPMLTFCAIS